MFDTVKCVVLLVFVLIYSSECISNNKNTDISAVDKNDGKSSLAFVFDVTGSMYNDLRQVREGAEMILNAALIESDVIADFVFVPYHDPEFGPATVTRDKDVFKKALNIVRVYGGGDCPEMSMSGIQMALNVSRPKSFLYVFTDATAADHRMVGKVLDLIQRKQSQVVFIMTGHCNDLDKPSYKVYQQVAAASSGQIFNLDKSSVHEMLEFVKSSIKSRTVNLASISNPAGYNHTQEIPVDSTLGEVTVSVSGAKPHITVVDPQGEKLTGPPKLITTVDLSEIMVVKVMQPEPGNWTITVGSQVDYSVKVVGLSNVTFNHGFSIQPTVSMQETSYRPLKGTYNHLMISLTQTNTSVDIHYAEILSLSGKTLFEVPLTLVDGTNDTYSAEPFIPPAEFFYIAINGRDQYNQELRRVGGTAIQGKTPDVPFLTVQKKVEAHSHNRVVLICNVESLVPVTVMWTKDDSKIRKEISSLQTTSLDYEIEDMVEEDVGAYRCTARNAAGTSTATTQIDIIVDPPQVTIEPKNMTVEAGELVTISCTVYSEALLLDNRLIYNGKNTSDAIELNKSPNIDGVYIQSKTIPVNENVTGVYSCVAANKGGKSTDAANISIKMNPTARILGPHTLQKRNNSELQLVCAGENALLVVWTSPNGTEYKKIDVNGTFNVALNVRHVISDGVWTCTASRGTRKGSDFVSVIVLITPVVNIVGDKNITIINGTILEVTCRVVARPAPRILWHRETEEFLNNTITEINPMNYQSVLTLNSSAERVDGTYFCFGENSEGIHQDYLTVNVRRKMSLVKGFNDTSVQLYYQIELQCIVDVYPPAVTYWYHNGTVLVTSKNVYITEDNTTVYLKRIDFTELGEYKCVVENQYEKIEVKGSIAVEGLASPMLSKEPKYLDTQLGQSTIITCRLLQGNPEPTVTWQYKPYNTKNFSSLSEGVIVNNDGLELTISNTSEVHSGIYQCAARNVIGQDIYDVNLVVQYPPKFIEMTNQSNTPLLVKLGEKVSLRCDAVGLPPPVTVWTKDGHPLVFTNPFSLRNGSELVIEKASSYQTGNYSCNVTSSIGSTQKNFTLEVYEPPKITSATDTILEVLEGELVELPCTIRGLPTPVVEWTQNGESLNTGKYIDKYGLRFVANLTDFGEYICKAVNTHGIDKVVYTLYVWVAPSIVPQSESSEVLVGYNITLRCDVVGFPLPIVQWMFNEEVLKKNTTDLWFNNVGYLHITKANTKHEGQYICLAENIAGHSEQPIYLKVNKAPEIMKDNYTGSYLSTSTDTVLSIACRCTGRPEPYVMWTKDDFYLNRDPRYTIDSDGTLHIKKPSEDMSGNYTCIAKNSVGQDNKTVPVQIYSVPVPIQSEESYTTVKLVEGNDAVVQCPVHATSVTLKWYKNAKLISEGPLRLMNVSTTNASTYSCVGTNAVGSAHSRVRVIVEWPPRFLELMNRTVHVVRGEDCYLHCDVDAKPNAKTKWVYNSKPLVFEDQQTLKLINVQLHDSGNYKCIVSNVHGTVIREFVLNVLEPPFISDFDMMDVQLKLGDNATLECSAKGKPAPNITWSYNNTMWQKQGPRISGVNITAQHIGLFRCDAENSAGVAHIVYRVTVVFAPRITDIVTYLNGEGVSAEHTVQVTKGTNTRISCKASANPQPDIQWLKQGRVVSENRYDIPYADLVLRNVETRHNGLYICVASNEGGTDIRKIKLDVLEPPKIFQSLFETINSANEHIEVLSGQSFYLHCHPYGNPLPDVYWFKDDVPLKIFDDTMVSTEFGEVLEVKRALEEQSGNYTCVARNLVGNTSVSYIVDVLVPPPTPKQSTKKVISNFGQPLTLSCPALGTQPSVMWIKHPYTEINNDTRISLVNDGFTLIINKTAVSDTGNYSCIVTNKVGTSEMIFDVVVYKRPSITGNIDSTNIIEELVVPLRRSIVLKCEVDGYPAPQITWLKDTQLLSDGRSNIQRVLGNSLLALWSAEPRDAGQYICVADNQAGTTHRRYNIVIQVPGKWSPWSSWSFCNVTCGLGYQLRARICQYTDENNNVIDSSTSSENIILDEAACKGPKNDTRKCHLPPCEVDEFKPRWTQWSQWSECSASCGVGTQARTRRCKTKAKCVGDNVQIKKCADLPFCSSNAPTRDNVDNIFDSTDDATNSTKYLPDMVIEMHPEVVNSHFSSDVEEFYSASGSQSPTVFFDVNVSKNLDGSNPGPCEVGYKYNASLNTCDDLDECTMERNQCHLTQMCVNTEGAYRCSCSPGYLALGAGQRCLDVNECELETDGCEFSCVNTAGGYVCACPRHLRLHIDGHHCVIPSLYRMPLITREPDYLSTNIDFPTKSTKPIRNI